MGDGLEDAIKGWHSTWAISPAMVAGIMRPNMVRANEDDLVLAMVDYHDQGGS